ncbi:MAG: hypothetical protein HYV97_00465 [Bdellovibrio sp.]|nr:hypothetical protein [Bdellovibrio sp.]
MKTKYSLHDVQEFARKKGGKCLSDIYGGREKMIFRCKEGHTWQAVPASIIRGTWCPVCAHCAPHDIEFAKAMAREKNGKCLSNRYINNLQHLLWECEKGHRWKTSLANVKGSISKLGTWCPKCQCVLRGRQRRLSIDEAHVCARGKGGECLSKTYETIHKKLLWRCKDGHTWRATLASVKHHRWCPICGSIKRAIKKCTSTLERVKKVAQEKGGECLSTGYKATSPTGNKKVRFKCKYGHEWEARPSLVISHKAWCPDCGWHRHTLEEMRTKAQQHGGECLSETYKCLKDKLRWRCRVGHIFEKTADSILRGKSWCSTCGNGKLEIKDFLNLAYLKNGKCLSDDPMLARRSKVEWQCHQGHIWKATYKQAKEEWCPDCAVISQRVFAQKGAA